MTSFLRWSFFYKLNNQSLAKALFHYIPVASAFFSGFSVSSNASASILREELGPEDFGGTTIDNIDLRRLNINLVSEIFGTFLFAGIVFTGLVMRSKKPSRRPSSSAVSEYSHIATY